MKHAIIAEIPDCDFCPKSKPKKAKYDGQTRFGAWAYMCQKHWEFNGIGKLGMGLGQKLVLNK